MTQIVVLPVLLPLLGAGLCLVFGRSARAQRLISVVVLTTVVITATTLLVRADRYGQIGRASCRERVYVLV